MSAPELRSPMSGALGAAVIPGGAGGVGVPIPGGGVIPGGRVIPGGVIPGVSGYPVTGQGVAGVHGAYGEGQAEPPRLPLPKPAAGVTVSWPDTVGICSKAGGAGA